LLPHLLLQTPLVEDMPAREDQHLPPVFLLHVSDAGLPTAAARVVVILFIFFDHAIVLRPPPVLQRAGRFTTPFISVIHREGPRFPPSLLAHPIRLVLFPPGPSKPQRNLPLVPPF